MTLLCVDRPITDTGRAAVGVCGGEVVDMRIEGYSDASRCKICGCWWRTSYLTLLQPALEEPLT